MSIRKNLLSLFHARIGLYSLILWLCLSAFGIRAQERSPGSHRVHLLSSFNYKKLTHALIKNASSDQEKVDNITYWITRHIRYDKRAYIHFKKRVYKPNRVLRRRKAVCDGYSRLFNDMCHEAGVSSAVIYGYGKDWFYDFGDTYFPDDHAWSAYRINNNWHLSDLTWASGGLYAKFGIMKFCAYKIHLRRFPFRIKYRRYYQAKYIDSDPKLLLNDHLPMVNYWQLLDKPVSVFDFENFSNETHLVHYRDSVLSSRSENRSCKDCDDMESVGYERQMQTEGLKEIEDNFRNTHTYIATVFNYMSVNGNTTVDDTVRLKQELLYYNDLYSTAQCNVENARKDYELNHNQNKNKVRLFKTYNDSIMKMLKKMQKSDKKLYKLNSTALTLDKKMRYSISNSARWARAKGTGGIIPKLKLTKAQEKKRKQAQKKMGDNRNKGFNKIAKSSFILLETDSLLRHDSLAFPTTGHHFIQTQGFSMQLQGLRKAFDDAYDLRVIQPEDSATNHAQHAYNTWKTALEPNAKLLEKNMKKACKDMLEGWDLLVAMKSNLREGARNDTQLKSWREENQETDSVITALEHVLADSVCKLQYDYILLQKTQLKSYKKAMKRIAASLSWEAFYDQSRHMLQEYYYRRRYAYYRSEAKMIAKRIGKQRSKIEKHLNSLRK